MAAVAEAGGARPLCLTIGNFDGVHIGHRSLLDLARERSICSGSDFAVMTFWPHPRVVLRGVGQHRPLTTRAERYALLANAGAARIIEIPFDHALASLSPEEFTLKYLLPGNVRELVIGHDFALGRNRVGQMELLCKLGGQYGFSVLKAPAFLFDGEPVSSTRLRSAISNRNMEAVRQMLGRNYSVSGTVGHGYQRGRELGFPTANLEGIEVLLPPNGVYATIAIVNGKRYSAVTNIGVNPTFNNSSLSVESFLLDADVDLYNTPMRLEFVASLRPEKKFGSLAELKAQIGLDVQKARQILSNM